jgi:hypothetical protein
MAKILGTILTLALMSGAIGCGLTLDEERAMHDEQEYQTSRSELIRKPSSGGLGFDMNKCIEDCKKENASDGTIDNLQVYCETRCEIREIFEGADQIAT